MKVIVCGSRDFQDFYEVSRVLADLHEQSAISTLIHGGAPGVDSLAGQWAKANNIPVIPFPADWERHGKAAGPIRNEAMIRERPDMLVAFPGGRGTNDMVKKAFDNSVVIFFAGTWP